MRWQTWWSDALSIFERPRILGLAIGTTLLSICAAVGAMLLTERWDDRARASIDLSNISSTVSQDIARNLELYDLSITGAVEGAQRPAVMQASRDLRQAIIFDRSISAPYLDMMLVLDEGGNVIIDSRTLDPAPANYSDRDYFRIHAQHADVGLYVSRPLRSRQTGEWIIGLSRRIGKPDGSFGGVVVGTFRLEYVHRLFSKLKLGAEDAMTLYRNDGTLTMREPYEATQIGTKQDPAILFDLAARSAEGEYEATSVVDGVRRVYHFHRIGRTPLVLNVGFSRRDVYQRWWHRASLMAFMLALCCGLITILTLGFSNELRRRTAAEAALANLADTDGLTGLFNRRYLDRALATEWRRAIQHGHPVSLLMIDGDHFKGYNDSFGHVAGDDLLKQLARCMERAARRTGDVAARYGGEEFTILLPGTDGEGALRVAEALRRSVLALSVSHPRSSSGQFTVSVGISTAKPTSGGAMQEWIASADAALYRSKSAGRNRTTSCEEKPFGIPTCAVSKCA